jgi:Acyl-CoA dehydrogenase, C-terminal domain
VAGGTDALCSLLEAARRRSRTGHPVIEDTVVHQRLGALAAWARIQRHLGQRMATKVVKGQLTANSSRPRIWFSEP